MTNPYRNALSLSLVFAIAACSSGANSLQTLPASGAGDGISSARIHHRGKGKLVLRIHVPKRRHHKRAKYVSSATVSMKITLSGPTPFSETVGLTASSAGCSGSLAGTFCTLTIPGLKSGSYTGSITTYDGANGSGDQLSANQSVGFTIVTAQSNFIGVALDGIPVSAVLLPAANSTVSGSTSSGFTLSKCGSDKVNVVGVDAGGNYVLGSGAPTPSLDSDNTAVLSVATPSAGSPNTFTIARPSAPPPLAGTVVHLTATVTPGSDSGASPVSTTAIPMTLNHDICGYITEFSNGITPGAEPQGITTGPDGNLWFAERSGNRIAKMTTDGTVTEYSAGISSDANPVGIAAGPDGNLWFTESSTSAIGKITTSGVVTEFASGITSGSYPYGIASGSDGNLWFTEYAGPRVAKITTSGTVTEYSAGITGSNPIGIASGSDGNLWFTESYGSKVAKVTTGGVITEYALTGSSSPYWIASGPDGNLWFPEFAGKRIGTVTTSGVVTEYSGLSAFPQGIAAGPDGNMWFTEKNGGNNVGKITPDGVVTEYSAGLTGGPTQITLGPDGNMWFTEAGSATVGRVQ